MLEYDRARSSSLDVAPGCTIAELQGIVIYVGELQAGWLLAAVFQSCCISSWRPSFVLQGCGLRLARVRLTLLELFRARQHDFEVCLMSGFQSGCDDVACARGIFPTFVNLAAVSCRQLLSAAVSCGQLRPAAASCGQLRSAAVSGGQLRSAAFSCGQLRSAAVSCV